MAVTADTNIGIGGTIDVSTSRFGTISHAGTNAKVQNSFTPTHTTDGTVVLPDLDEAFFVGTTIALLAPADTQLSGGTNTITSAANAVQAKDVVISEIMWGIDTQAKKDKQWIEFYNTTAGDGMDANMEAWILYFVDDYNDIPAPAEKAIDHDNNPNTDAITVKNVVDLGSGGRRRCG